MKRILLPLWRVSLCLFIVSVSVVAIILLLIGGSYLQVKQQFAGNGTLPADCALVFGAAVYGSIPSPAILRRVSTAATLYREEKVKKLILSGGRGEGNRQSEATVMRREAINLGVDAEDISIEDQSHSTWENLLYSQNLTSQCSSIVGISDGYHLARIELLARRQGWKNFGTIPTELRPPEMSEHRSVLRETFAYLYYALWMNEWITKESLLKNFIDQPEKAFVPEKILQSA